MQIRPRAKQMGHRDELERETYFYIVALVARDRPGDACDQIG